MSLPDVPKRGLLITWSCIDCDKVSRMKIIGSRKNAPNEDGSTCYTVKLECPNCGYINGQYRPIWYNFYKKGVIC